MLASQRVGLARLHIDDPSSTAFDAKGELKPLSLERVLEATKPAGIPDAIQQLPPDMLHHQRPGRRYWLRAAVPFQPNPHSAHSTTDFWCDHQDSKGFRVYVNHVPEPRGLRRSELVVSPELVVEVTVVVPSVAPPVVPSVSPESEPTSSPQPAAQKAAAMAMVAGPRRSSRRPCVNVVRGVFILRSQC